MTYSQNYLTLRPYSLLEIVVGPFFGTSANIQALENDRNSCLEDLTEVFWGHDPHSTDGGQLSARVVSRYRRLNTNNLRLRRYCFDKAKGIRGIRVRARTQGIAPLVPTGNGKSAVLLRYG